MNAVINCIANLVLLGDPLSSTDLPHTPAALAPLLLMLGGMIEGVIAEYSFNQCWHFSAVVVKEVKHIGATHHESKALVRTRAMGQNNSC